MPNNTLAVHIKSVLPLDTDSALFLGNGHKTIVITIDSLVARLMVQAINGEHSPRPTTHDLMGAVFQATGSQLQRVVINDMHDGQFYGRMILTMQNEIKAMKIMEIDCRPSDGIILAIRAKAPILCSVEVWDKCEDVTQLHAKLTNNPSLSEIKLDFPSLPEEEDAPPL